MPTRPPAVAVLVVLASACSAPRQPADLVIKARNRRRCPAGHHDPRARRRRARRTDRRRDRRRLGLRSHELDRRVRRLRHAGPVGQPCPLRRRPGPGRREPQPAAAVPRPWHHHRARRGRRSERERAGVAGAGGRWHAARADDLHLGTQAGGHRLDLAGRPRSRVRGRRPRRARSPAGDARRLRQDHREHADRAVVYVRARRSPAPRLHRLGPRPGRAHARSGVRGRARVDRAHVVLAARRLAARGGTERRGGRRADVRRPTPSRR